jgi:hypothetical protein
MSSQVLVAVLFAAAIPLAQDLQGLWTNATLTPLERPKELAGKGLAYNNNYRILQIPGYVVIFIEMIHDVRLIPLDGRPHLASNIRQWMGDPRGRWEGNTLVVDSTNFTDKYACHEGNYAMTNILRGARAEEAARKGSRQ